MLPGADGFDLCRDIRAESPVGIIVVSARRGEQDKVRALNLGADDYLTKPFGVDELLARITACSCAAAGPAPAATAGRAAAPSATSPSTSTRSSSPRAASRSTSRRPSSRCSGARARARAAAQHAVLLRKVWGPGYETETEYTRVYVRRLRAKLEDADGPPLIVTEPRAGYRMVPR